MKLIFLSVVGLFFIKNVFSAPLMCTMCSVGIASGLGLAKLLGVSENVIGLWYGATLFVIGYWTVFFIQSKNIKNIFLKIIFFLSSYCLLIPIYMGKNPSIVFNSNKILFLDKFLFYNILGSLIVYFVEIYYRYMKQKNSKPHFQFERVILPLVALLFFSIII